MSATGADTASGRPLSAALSWGGVVLLALCGAMSALLECLLVPLYAGSIVIPVAAVGALVGNWFLPRAARSLVPSTLAALLPFAAWMVVLVGAGFVLRPEGDVILPGSGPGGVEYVTYAMMLLGVLAGVVSVITSAPVIPVERRRPR